MNLPFSTVFSTLSLCETSRISRQGTRAFSARQQFLVPLFAQRSPVPGRLKTDDEREAITRALRLQQDPELSPTNTLKPEIKEYVADRLAANHWTKNNAYNSQSILMAMADFVEVKEPARLSANHLQRWYEHLTSRTLKPLTEYSAHAYMRSVRTFLKHMVSTRKFRQNVATEG
jgi:hypothetical protein